MKPAAPPDAAHAAKERRRLLVRALAQALVAGTAASLFLLYGHRPAGIFLVILAALFLFGGCLYPPLYRLLEKLGTGLGTGLGTLLTWILLGGVFFLLFAPAGLVIRMLRRDPLRRRMNPAATSYWVASPSPERSRTDWQRQF